jgi:GntR family transcriptional regulator
MLNLHPDSGVPLYLQVAEALREAIAAGIYPEDEPVPSLRALASEIRVNYHTIAKAYRLLEDEGVIARRRGGPYLVVPRSGDEAALELLRKDADQLARRARAFGVSPEEALALLDQAMKTKLQKEKSR